MDLVSQLVESILAELEPVSVPRNSSKEIGASDKMVQADMTDMLPHHGVFERNKPQSYAAIFSATSGKSFAKGFERETPPPKREMQKRRNNDGGKWHSISKKGDKSALLHSDFASSRPHNVKPILP
jgi:hypothetical protein